MFYRYYLQACCCVDNCQSHCPCVSRCVYDSSGRLTDKVREMAEKQELGVILECNASCFCSSQCPSRVAQNGVRSHLEVGFLSLFFETRTVT